MSMTNTTDRVEIITSGQRRRRWTASEKVRMVEETFEPGMTVSLVAPAWRCSEPAVHVAPPGGARRSDCGGQWRRSCACVGLPSPADLQNQVRELHRLLGKKTLEAEILKEALEHAAGSKKQLRLPPSLPKDGSR